MQKGQLVKILRSPVHGITMQNFYGEYVATDGDKVVIKTGNNYEAYPMSYVEEVLPYSIGVQFIASDNYRGRSPASTVYNYVVEKSADIEVGDLVWIENTSGYAKVVAVDTKSKKAVRRIIGSVYKKGGDLS